MSRIEFIRAMLVLALVVTPLVAQEPGAPVTEGDLVDLAPGEAGQQDGGINLILEEASARLDGRLNRAMELMAHDETDAALRIATEVTGEWMDLVREWQGRVLKAQRESEEIEGENQSVEASLDLYLQGQQAAQGAVRALGQILQGSGQAREQDQLLLKRLLSLNATRKIEFLAEAVRDPIRETENLLMARANSYASSGQERQSVELLTRLHRDLGSETQRKRARERLLALYSDLISSGKLDEAAGLALWYAANGNLRSHIWRAETARLARLAISGKASCNVSGFTNKQGVLLRLDIPGLLCRFFVNPGLADPEHLLLLGQAYQFEHRYRAAIRWYRAALETRDHQAEIYRFIAQCQAAIGQIEPAAQSVAAAISRGYPVLWLLEDPELEAIRGTRRYHSLREGTLF